MKPISFSRTVAALAWATLSALPLQAEFIQPVAVWVSNGEETQDALINGLGFEEPGVGSPAAIHSRDSVEMWSVVGSIKADAVFDLGQTVNLTKVYVWNYNVANDTDRGMKEVEVLVSPDANMTNANFNAIAMISLTEGGQTGQVFSVVGTSVRLVKLKGLSNWGHGWSVGLAEARFESGDISGNVPSIVINSPHEGDVISSGNDITLDAKVTDKDADLLKVEFFDGNTLLTNKSTGPYTVLVKAPATGEHAYRIVATDKSGKTAWAIVNITVREFVADRIIQIDDTADIGEDLNQIQYTGTWNLAQGNNSDPRFNHNDHYSDVRNAYFDVRFKGVRIDLYATVASHHGSGLATIDGGPTNTISYKATQRKEQALVWSSPILPNREHTLRVRVAGSGVVTADRFDVHVSDKPEELKASITKVEATFTHLTVELTDTTTSVVDPATAKLSVDGAQVVAKVVKGGAITTLDHTPAVPFAPGSSHTVKVDAKETTGGSLSSESSFTLPKPFFPLTGLGGPPSKAGNWGFRQIWNAGRADAVDTAVEIALKADQPGFTGRIQDTAVPVINFGKTANPGAGGLIPDDLPLPAETEGLSESDFVIVAHAKIKIPRSGDWTLGVHSDEGFALRVIGAPFDSVNGNGMRDDDFPEYMAVPVNSTDSNTRGILKGIAAGAYELELITWERSGAAFYEVYAAEGAFEEDAATDQWVLIGAPGGLEIIASGPKLTILRMAKNADRVTIDFVTPDPSVAHQLQETSDFKAWPKVASAVFEKTGDNAMRATVSGVTAATRFYRIALP